MNLRGNVPTNTIDQFFYENRSPETVKVYQANCTETTAGSRSMPSIAPGTSTWGYEGDFFGLYREANYGLNIDTYDATAYVGFEIAAHVWSLPS